MISFSTLPLEIIHQVALATTRAYIPAPFDHARLDRPRQRPILSIFDIVYLSSTCKLFRDTLKNNRFGAKFLSLDAPSLTAHLEIHTQITPLDSYDSGISVGSSALFDDRSMMRMPVQPHFDKSPRIVLHHQRKGMPSWSILYEAEVDVTGKVFVRVRRIPAATTTSSSLLGEPAHTLRPRVCNLWEAIETDQNKEDAYVLESTPGPLGFTRRVAIIRESHKETCSVCGPLRFELQNEVIEKGYRVFNQNWSDEIPIVLPLGQTVMLTLSHRALLSHEADWNYDSLSTLTEGHMAATVLRYGLPQSEVFTDKMIEFFGIQMIGKDEDRFVVSSSSSSSSSSRWQHYRWSKARHGQDASDDEDGDIATPVSHFINPWI